MFQTLTNTPMYYSNSLTHSCCGTCRVKINDSLVTSLTDKYKIHRNMTSTVILDIMHDIGQINLLPDVHMKEVKQSYDYLPADIKLPFNMLLYT